jgi:hypothetical protein
MSQGLSESHPSDSNRRPADYESAALPTELGWQINEISDLQTECKTRNLHVCTMWGNYPSIFFGGLASTTTTALTSSLSRIVVALESRKGSMAGDRHNTLVVPSPAYFSSDKGVSEVMKVEVLYPGPPVGSMKSGLLSFSH